MAYSITHACNGCTACARLCPTGAITGEKKEIHMIEPGACILCGACGRICPAGAVLDEFGLTATRVPKKQWARPRFDLDKCMSCAICLDTCPTGAISQGLQKKGSPHLFPFLEKDNPCIACGFCALDCPAGAIEMGTPQTPETPKKEKAN